MGVDEAAELLGVPRDRVLAMVDEGLLHPVGSGGEPLELDAAEVRAVHDLGG
jgi:excisionase family DNA binding protein